MGPTGKPYHIVIECVTPELEGGRYPAKRMVGDECEVGADIIKDGHDILGARLRYRAPGAEAWRVLPLVHDFDADRWRGSFALDRIGRWTLAVEAWTDRFATWRSELEKKLDAGQDVGLELVEGALLIESTARRVRDASARTALKDAAQRLRNENASLDERGRIALSADLLAAVEAHHLPDDLTAYGHELEIIVDREAAGFAAWYELFPRSQARRAGEHGTFADAAAQLPRIAGLGFDVVYLPPVHPIGRTFRKGRNNTLDPEPTDVGSPWAIGNEHGGHTGIEPGLGSIRDFERFVERARELGMEVALDYALNCSPDHPWVKEHPDWFHARPDGSIRYAENPPKKYQDIYPLDFWCDDREGLWNACLEIFRVWIARGVKTFRVDNPHTKPFAFWEWVIAEVQREHPDVVFLAEAFTRPKKMKNLAKLGFTQSYTYFTWKNTAVELTDLAEDLTGPAAEYMRGNLFANTPDILHEYLQDGGRPAFRIRLLLAATLLPVYGIYSGYELCENVPVRAGSEEYMNSEKYELRRRDYEAAGNINEDIRVLNRIRREQHVLRRYANISFHFSENDNVLFYRKAAMAQARSAAAAVATAAAIPGGAVPSLPPAERDVFVAVNLDPEHVHESMVHVPLADLGIGPGEPYVMEDLITGARYTWHGSRNYVRLDPAQQPGHVLRLER
ncbi:MAG: alpha-1,4-glucan--maltose-1-phosphate maltosyltransferase [Gemmatimonadaceae bacterium]